MCERQPNTDLLQPISPFIGWEVRGSGAIAWCRGPTLQGRASGGLAAGGSPPSNSGPPPPALLQAPRPPGSQASAPFHPPHLSAGPSGGLTAVLTPCPPPWLQSHRWSFLKLCPWPPASQRLSKGPLHAAQGLAFGTPAGHPSDLQPRRQLLPSLCGSLTRLPK